MHTLYLCRHAKSDWTHDLPDFERPLNERGLNVAPRMGALLVSKGFMPDLIISSPAIRALTTAALVASAMGYPAETILQQEGIYESGAGSILSILQQLPEAKQKVMVFGHNPGMSNLVSLLSNTDGIHMSTCAMAGFSISSKWSDISPATAKLNGILRPKEVL